MAPLSVFHVQKGKRYRFRLINSASNVCPFLFQVSFKQTKQKTKQKQKQKGISYYFVFCFLIFKRLLILFKQIEGHRMKVIASDSGNVKPFLADSLYLTSGERYDFVIDADKKQGNFFSNNK